jgi:hypothetical protein
MVSQKNKKFNTKMWIFVEYDYFKSEHHIMHLLKPKLNLMGNSNG